MDNFLFITLAGLIFSVAVGFTTLIVTLARDEAYLYWRACLKICIVGFVGFWFAVLEMIIFSSYHFLHKMICFILAFLITLFLEEFWKTFYERLVKDQIELKKVYLQASAQAKK